METEYKISIIHPSRKRPERAYEAAKNWIGKMRLPTTDWEYILSIDTDDPTSDEYRKLFSDSHFTITMNPNNSCISAINIAATLTTGNLIIVVSDDFDCPDEWDTMLLAHLESMSDYVVKTLDGIQPIIITLPIMDRKYYNRFGYIYFPSYSHMFCDTEFTAVATILDKVVNVPMTFPHLHYTKGLSVKDEVNVKNDNTWRQGEKLYRERLKAMFYLKQEEVKNNVPKEIRLR